MWGHRCVLKKPWDVLGNILQEWRQVYLGTPGVLRVISIVDIKGRRDRKHLTVTIHTTVTTPPPKNTQIKGLEHSNGKVKSKEKSGQGGTRPLKDAPHS